MGLDMIDNRNYFWISRKLGIELRFMVMNNFRLKQISDPRL